MGLLAQLELPPEEATDEALSVPSRTINRSLHPATAYHRHSPNSNPTTRKETLVVFSRECFSCTY